MMIIIGVIIIHDDNVYDVDDDDDDKDNDYDHDVDGY